MIKPIILNSLANGSVPPWLAWVLGARELLKNNHATALFGARYASANHPRQFLFADAE